MAERMTIRGLSKKVDTLYERQELIGKILEEEHEANINRIEKKLDRFIIASGVTYLIGLAYFLVSVL